MQLQFAAYFVAIVAGLLSLWPPIYKWRRTAFWILAGALTVNLICAIQDRWDSELQNEQTRDTAWVREQMITAEAKVEQKRLRKEIANLEFTLGEIYTATAGKKLDENKIQMVLGYAYGLNYLGSTNEPGNESRIILPSKPIRVRYSDSQFETFWFGLANLNTGIPLHNPLVHLVFPKGLEVKPVGCWKAMYVNQHYFCYAGTITNSRGIMNGALGIQFPHKGKYTFRAEIDGAGIRPIVRMINLDVS